MCQPPNQQLQRTVIRHRVRAAGAAWPLCACGRASLVVTRPLNCTLGLLSEVDA